MKRASKLFSDRDLKMVEEAVARAESRTSGEIVPVVATSSGRYDRGEDLFGVILALIAVAASWLLWQDVTLVESGWSGRFGVVLGLVPILLIFLGAFVIGVVLATLLPELRLPFVLKAEMANEVERSARAAFHSFRVRETAEGTGILIYVSLFERMVRVLGDESIDAKLPQDQWEELCALVVEGMRTGAAADGLVKAIELCGERLAEHFPIREDDHNELRDTLHLID